MMQSQLGNRSLAAGPCVHAPGCSIVSRASSVRPAGTRRSSHSSAGCELPQELMCVSMGVQAGHSWLSRHSGPGVTRCVLTFARTRFPQHHLAC